MSGLYFYSFRVSMNTPSNTPENRDGKRFLKTQVYTISEKIWKALSRYDDPPETEEQDFHTMWAENKNIKDILEEKSDLFRKRAIVWDIWSYSRKLWWEEKQITQFKCKYWLWITIDNLNSFLDFCAIHGFIPMVDKIYIESNDISQIKELYTLFAFAITKPWNPLIINSLANEIKKLEKNFQWPAKDVLIYLQQIVGYTTSTYQYLLWDKLQKLKNVWTLSENIFAEVAIRMENQIRDRVWIESSYLKLAWYRDDMEKKTDMDFIIKKTPNQSYQLIPMQFTTWSPTGEKIKEKNIEAYLIKLINEWVAQTGSWSFILFSVNGEFSKHITHGEKGDNLMLNQEYEKRVNDPWEREKTVWSKFPLFIDSIDHKIIQPAEIMYIALHMLYKKYNFKCSQKESYLNAFKIGKIDKLNHQDINWVKLSDIYIDKCDVEKIDHPRPDYPGIQKHRFVISYQWEPMWVIVIYEVER